MLAQLTTVKARLGITDTTDDTLLTNMIAHASGRFDVQCRRLFTRTVNKEDEFVGDDTELRLICYPIETVASFHLKYDETEGWVLESDVDYLIRRGSLISLHGKLASEAEQLKVTYTGGYVLPGTAPVGSEVALPSEIEQGCVEQVSYWYQNRNRLGLVTVSGEGGNVQQFAQLDLLQHVKAVLMQHERWNN